VSSTTAANQYAKAMAALTTAREQQMPDECTVTRPATATQTPVLDAGGNVTKPTADPPVYEGPCTLFSPTAAVISGQTVNDQSGVPDAQMLKVPHRAELQPGDLVTITAAAYSPGLVGEVFVVHREGSRSYATYRLYQLRGSSWESATTGT
jgi:hypothetical protein